MPDLNPYELNLNKFIDSNLFNINTYLLAYTALVTIRQLEPSLQNYTEKHHIIPRSYYKYFKSTIDNSKTNLVKLSYKEHILAHYYLYKCTINNQLKINNARALLFILSSKQSLQIKSLAEADQLVETELLKILETDSFELEGIKQAVADQAAVTSKNNWANPAYREERLRDWTKERRDAVGAKVKQWHKNNANAYTKAVVCLETGKIFNSIKEAETFYDTGHHISMCCKNPNRRAGGYHWAYVNEVPNIDEVTKEATNKKYVFKKRVYCVELNKVFDSAEAAGRELKAHPAHIRECCRGKLKTHKKLHWRYYDEN